MSFDFTSLVSPVSLSNHLMNQKKPPPSQIFLKKTKTFKSSALPLLLLTRSLSASQSRPRARPVSFVSRLLPDWTCAPITAGFRFRLLLVIFSSELLAGDESFSCLFPHTDRELSEKHSEKNPCPVHCIWLMKQYACIIVLFFQKSRGGSEKSMYFFRYKVFK